MTQETRRFRRCIRDVPIRLKLVESFARPPIVRLIDFVLAFPTTGTHLRPYRLQYVPRVGSPAVERLADVVSGRAVATLHRAEAGPAGALQMRRFRQLPEVAGDGVRPGDLHAGHRQRPARPADRVGQPKALRPPDSTGGHR